MNKWIKKTKSKIHSKGMIAKTDIPKKTRIIEYVGNKITKKQSDDLYEKMLETHKKNTKKGSVYAFILNKKYDIDGNVNWNPARLINHSCDPNCEAIIDRGHIWIQSMREIPKGEEITYDYGYDLDTYSDHPCYCGSKHCAGYIVTKRQRWRLANKIKSKKILSRKRKK